MASPIADLSYRNYDGPIEAPRHRWWAIAKMGMRLTFKKRAYWWFMLMSGWYYLAMIFTLFLVDRFTPTVAQAAGQATQGNPFLDRLVWKDQFLHGFSFGQLPLLIVTLMLAAGAIANDNRANALLVYLSKPCTKRDYVAGKWFGVFFPLFLLMFIPATVFFLYAGMSYRNEGFFSDPWVYPKMLLVCAVAAGFHAGLCLGISSLFNQGRNAGAAYAGMYFLSNFFTQLMTIAFVSSNRGRGAAEAIPLLSKLYYASIDGMNIGAAKVILGTDGSPVFNVPSRMPPIPAPPFWMPLLIMGGLTVLGMLLAWNRVRAVEVVG